MTHTILTSTDWALMRLAPGIVLMAVFALLAALAGIVAKGRRKLRRLWLSRAGDAGTRVMLGDPQRR